MLMLSKTFQCVVDRISVFEKGFIPSVLVEDVRQGLGGGCGGPVAHRVRVGPLRRRLPRVEDRLENCLASNTDIELAAMKSL